MKIITLPSFFFSLSLFAQNCPPEDVFIQDVYSADYGRTQALEPHRFAPTGCKAMVVIPAIKFESFGKVNLEFEFAPSVTGVAVIEGPIPNPDDGVPAQAPVAARWDISKGGKRALSLSAPGIIRLYVLSDDKNHPSVPAAVKASCEGDCARRALKLGEILKLAKEQGYLDSLSSHLESEISSRLAESETREKIVEYLRQLPAMAVDKLARLERFPVFPPMYELKHIQPWLEGGSEKTVADKEFGVEEVSLAELLNGPLAETTQSPIHPSLPQVRYGHFLKNTLTKSQIRQSENLSRALNALVKGGLKRVVVGTQNATTPRELFDALIRRGNVIEVRSERTYANFLSLKIGNVESQTPVWLRTGLAVPGTQEELVVPMGHSQFSWYLWGPDVNARIAFYLGTNGAGFFALTDERPAWTGVYSLYGSLAGARDTLVLNTVETAAKYLKRNQEESRGLRADGYGVLGVCNDSTALIEQAVRGQVTVYPLVRSRRLANRGDGLDEFFLKIPTDADLTPEQVKSESYQQEALCRVLCMSPHTAQSRYIPDAKLLEQITKLRSVMENECLRRLGR